MGDFNAGSLYDVNKELMKKEKSLTEKELKDEINEKLNKYFNFSKSRYYMLLCHEERNYTIFHLTNPSIFSASILLNELYVCLTNRGSVKSIDVLKDGAVEIWIKIVDHPSPVVYYLFPCDACVIEG